MRSVQAIVGTVAIRLACATAFAAPPDHIVIVIEENHGLSQVIGYPGAPFINDLAAHGALFTDFYGLTHPSQPNYLHLYCGSSMGVLNDNIPAGSPFNTPNLGASLLAAGRTFASYSEDLPYAGFNSATFSAYARKHNPAANWQSPTPGLYQLPLALNKPFADFPVDFTQLPTVSIVVPNLNNDMHDGTVEQGDAWLSQKLGLYAQWALANNSLLVVTWDEDGFTQRNQIPTILYGANIRSGEYHSTYTLHNLLRTIVDLYNAERPGSAQLVSPLAGLFQSDPNIRSVSIHRTTGSTVTDTYVDSSVPGVSRAAISPIVVDNAPSTMQGLVRFDSFVGRAAGQAPPGAQVLSAKLKLLTGPASGDLSANGVAAHRMIRSWVEGSTWNSLGAGVQLDGIEANATAEFTVLPNVLDAWAIFDVTSSVRDMVLHPETNQGWVLVPTGGDGWRFTSSEGSVEADRPTLEVTFLSPVCDGDLSADGIVDDTDFVLFASSYDNFMVPPASAFADFNADGVVDDGDFVLFAAAYDAFLCD
ncbi:MAG: alkaline phosphatase family protein [Phycisphaerales bacterium]